MNSQRTKINEKSFGSKVYNSQIKTSYDCPPIPSRGLDWSAWDDDTYDASYEGEDENGYMWKASSPCGHGATEQEAIDDLKEQLLIGT